jgi:hypothetical protein
MVGSVCCISETTERVSTKFDVVGLHQVQYNVFSTVYISPNLIPVLHESSVDFDFLESDTSHIKSETRVELMSVIYIGELFFGVPNM